MAATVNEAPGRRWELSAPESEVLLRGPKTNDTQALKLALKELVVRQTLSLVTVRERRRIGPARRTYVLTRGPGRDSDVARPLQAVLEVYRNARPPVQQPDHRWSLTDEDSARIQSYAGASRSPRGVWSTFREAYRAEMAIAARAQAHVDADGTVGVPVRELAASVFRRYHQDGWILWTGRTAGYVRVEVLPALCERGLFTWEERRRLGCFGATRLVLTPAGSAAKADIEARLAISRPARRRGEVRGLAGELRTLAGSLGSLDAIDAAFDAIDRGVDRGWFDVYGD